MKKGIIIGMVLIFLLACDLSTSLAPTEETTDMVATVNSIMTTFPTMENQSTTISTSQPTLLAPIPSVETPGAGTGFPTLSVSGTLINQTAEANGTLYPSGTTPFDTSTPTITPTFIPEDPRNIIGAPSWIDTYTNGNNWPQGSDQFTSVSFENGFMRLTALSDTDGWRLTYPNIKNFYLEATVQTSNCEKTDHFGILFRVPDITAANEGYFYGIQCDGKYFLKVYAEKQMTSLVYPKANPAVYPGKDAVNRLGIMAEADKLSLYVNGTLIKEVTDNRFEHGGFGIFVGSDVVKNLSVSVDEIAYWTLP
jgi:hypothetical protein